MFSRLLLLSLALSALQCHRDDQASAGSSAKPNASEAPTTPAEAAKAGWTHVKQSRGECTFEFDAPVVLKETAKDDLSFTLSSDDFEFYGAEGQALTAEPKNALDMFKDEYEDVYRGVNAGLNLAIVKKKKEDGQANKNAQISGSGAEIYQSGRSEGCAFNCSGSREKEADVVTLCKSVRITVTPKAE